MLMPSRVKYRKPFRRPLKGKAKGGNYVAFGEYGLKSMECGWLTANQIEAARRAISNATKRSGRTWIRVFPDKPFTQKGTGTMGAGKGEVKGYVAVVKPGRIMFEISGISPEDSQKVLKLAAAKLPVVCKIVTKK